MLGRAFQPEDNLPGAAPVVILSHSLWQRHFAGDLGIIGRAIRERDRSYTVVGVLPERLTFPIGPMPAWRVLATVALVACWLPARRAAGIDPMEALRSE